MTTGKAERADKIKEMKSRIEAEFLPAEGEAKYTPQQVSGAFAAMEEKVVRDMILEGVRMDGRTNKQIRSLWCEVGTLPRAHGSALFQRGETQALVVTKPGTVSD